MTLKYKILLYLLSIISLLAIWDHVLRGFVLYSSQEYLLSLYNFLVSITLFVFMGGYAKKLEEHINYLEKMDSDKKNDKKLTDSMESFNRKYAKPDKIKKQHITK